MSEESPPPELDAPREITAIARGAGIVMLGTVAGSGLKYLFEFFAARRLGPELFGVFFLGLTIFRILEKLCTLELTTGMLRFVSLHAGAGDSGRVKGTIVSGLKLALTAAGAAAALLLLAAGPLSRSVFHAAALPPVLRIMAIGLVFAAATEILVFSLQALGRVEYRVLVRLAFEPALALGLILAFLRPGGGLGVAALSFVSPLVLGCLLAFHLARRTFPPLTEPRPAAVSEAATLLRFSLPLSLAGLLSVFLLQINPLMLGYFRPAAEVGVFAAALRTTFILPLVLEAFNAVFAPMIADLTQRRDLARLEDLFKVVTKWTVTVSLPAFLLLVFFGRRILGLWGDGYAEGLTCLVLIGAGQLVNCATGPVGYMISMSGRTGISLANAGGVLALNVILNLALIPRCGMMGGAAALSGSMAAVNLVRLIEVRWILGMHPYRLDVLKPVAAAALAFAAAALSRSGAALVSGDLPADILGALVFSGGYAAVLLALGVGKEDRLVFARLKRKFGPSRSED